jgi:hypothetical protein
MSPQWHEAAQNDVGSYVGFSGVKRKCCKRSEFDAHDPNRSWVRSKFRSAAVAVVLSFGEPAAAGLIQKISDWLKDVPAALWQADDAVD